MDRAARVVMANYPDIVLSFGQSDEYRYFLFYSTNESRLSTIHSFLFRRSTSLYSRRASKILSTVVSLFTSAYLMNWSRYFDTALPKENYPPSFDGRITLYPTEKEVRDYFAWRQVDSTLRPSRLHETS
jgi:tRNA(His) guanylyltransferase